MIEALVWMKKQNLIPGVPLKGQVGAVSVGILHGRPILDLAYQEDRDAEVDMNVVATATGEIVEIQGTGEQRSFRRDEMDRLVDLALHGISDLVRFQAEALAPILAALDDAGDRGHRKPAVPKDEKDLWGRP